MDLQSLLKEEAKQAFDPLTILPPVIEFFLPIASGETLTMFGFWVETTGLLKITIQQAIVPDNIFAQIKIITLRLPGPLFTMVFLLGFALYSVAAGIAGERAIAKATAAKLQTMLQGVIDKMNNGEF